VPPAFPPAIPSLDYGARFRMGMRFQNPSEPKKLNDQAMQVDADLYMGGAIHRFLKWQAGVTVTYSGNGGTATAPASAAAPTILPLDILAKFEPMPEFNVYMGRMIVVADRYTPSGPWGMDEFIYPGVFTGPLAPTAIQKSSNTGRDLGVNIWGAPLGGLIKYYLGSYQFHDPALSPLWSGRLQVSLLSPEPGFYQRTTYYGDKDLLSFGVGGQYQKNGSVRQVAASGMTPAMTLTDNHGYFTADLNFEKRIGTAGTLSAYGAFNTWFGDYRAWKNFFHASVGWTFPQVIGIGKLRPNIRYQQGVLNSPEDLDPSRIIDVQLSYLVVKWFARFNVGYRRTTFNASKAAGAQDGNMLWFGLVYADP
jgi:hypothetical protein